jgi:uncharacterized metal-binding protein YceD (DUF177 family)
MSKPEPFGLQIDVRNIDVEEMDFAGEIPAKVFELENDVLSKPLTGLKYRVHIQLAGKELVASGDLEAEFDCCCAKCGEFFSTSVRTPSFLRAYDLSEGVEILDLTPDLREDLLLELPAYPACAEAATGTCPNLQRVREVEQRLDKIPGEDNRWGGLDNIKL